VQAAGACGRAPNQQVDGIPTDEVLCRIPTADGSTYVARCAPETDRLLDCVDSARDAYATVDPRIVACHGPGVEDAAGTARTRLCVSPGGGAYACRTQLEREGALVRSPPPDSPPDGCDNRTIPNELLHSVMRSDAKLMYRARQVSNQGGFMAGSSNNGAHSANGITAMFIATGQDAANVAESSAAIVYAELRDNEDYYFSITIPSLIVATYGGGTHLATQRECLEMLGCYGTGKVRKFAEIVAATVLCGELSLGSAIVAEEWVSAHDLYGRNRR
jgi:hypothetical protein